MDAIVIILFLLNRWMLNYFLFYEINMIDGKSIIALIPARGGSKGVPRKNLYQFRGKSLLAHAIHTAQHSQYIDCIVVSSEDDEIIQEAKKQGAQVPFVRPISLAQDETASIDVILHALALLPHYDYVLLLQVTSPLRTAYDIDACIAHCIHNNAPSCVSIVSVEKHPFWMITMEHDGRLKKIFPKNTVYRRQDLPEVYVPNGAIFIAKSPWLKNSKTFLSDETLGFVMPRERSIDIDTSDDVIYLEKMYDHVATKSFKDENLITKVGTTESS